MLNAEYIFYYLLCFLNLNAKPIAANIFTRYWNCTNKFFRLYSKEKSCLGKKVKTFNIHYSKVFICFVFEVVFFRFMRISREAEKKKKNFLALFYFIFEARWRKRGSREKVEKKV